MTRTGICLAILGIGALAGCTNYVFELRVPESVKEVNRVVPAGRPTPADILFMVDNSGSMADEQENLARNFDRFINVLSGSSGDYQIAVVTTDLDSNGEQQGLRNYTPNNTYPYNVNLVPTSQTCMPAGIEHGCFRGPDPNLRIVKSTQLNAQQQISAFQGNVRVGSCGAGDEKGLGSALLALQNSRGGCNNGFLRDGANLVIVFVTDEEDNTQNPRQIAELVNAYAAVKSPANIRVAGIVGARDGRADRCGAQATCGSLCNNRPPPGSGTACQNQSQCPAGEDCIGNRCDNPALRYFENCWWCSYYSAPDCCSSDQSGRYVDFLNQMAARIRADKPELEAGCTPAAGQRAACLIDSICQAEFDQTLVRIARDLVITNDFILDPPASYPPGVVVIINGTKLTRCESAGQMDCDYTVRLDGNGMGVGLSISGPRAPKEGDTIEIYYAVKE